MADIYPPLADPPLDAELLATDPTSRLGKPVRPRFSPAWQQFFLRLRDFLMQPGIAPTIGTGVAHGAPAGTAITLPGVQPGDTIDVATYYVTTGSGTTGNVNDIVDATASFTVTGVNTVQSTMDTSHGKVQFLWRQPAA
jgi:hypothetical protein